MIDLIDALHFHHIGVACRSLSIEQRGWEALGYRQEGVPFSDPLQGVCGMFLTGPGPRVELLEPLPGSETLSPFLKAGVKMYHYAYETPALGPAIEALKAKRAKIVSPPKPAVAFGGRNVTFLVLSTSMIVELIEMA